MFLGGEKKKRKKEKYYRTTMHVSSNLEREKRNPNPNLILSNSENTDKNVLSSLTKILEIK